MSRFAIKLCCYFFLFFFLTFAFGIIGMFVSGCIIAGWELGKLNHRNIYGQDWGTGEEEEMCQTNTEQEVNTQEQVNTSPEYIQQLEEENRRLRKEVYGDE